MRFQNDSFRARGRALLVWTVAGVTLVLVAATANAAIVIVNQVEGFRGSNRALVTTAHNGTTEVNYDATGVDKLVVAIGTESGFNNNKVTSVGVSFNGVPLTLAVQDNFAPPTDSSPFSNDGGYAGIFYLDNPFQGVANFSLSTTTTGGGPNGGHVSIIGLAGTADGVGNTAASWTSQTSAGNVSTSITTSSDDAMVIAGVQNSGSNNGAGTPNAVSPLTLSNNGQWGSSGGWGGAASGYQFVPADGTTITPTFSTNAGGSIHVVAAEFQAEPWLKGELGLLDLSANGGINPATGEPWKYGDTYRFAFHTNEQTGRAQATATDIEWYNTFVQDLADASTVYPISAADGATWKVIGSTATVDARDNTETNPNVDGPGEAIFLLDGTTLVASDYNDLWDGSIENMINLTETGEDYWFWTLTGTLPDGTARPGGWAAQRGPLGDPVAPGQAGNQLSQWIYRVNTSSTGELGFYALSMPLSVVPEPSSAMLVLLGLVGLLMVRRKR